MRNRRCRRPLASITRFCRALRPRTRACCHRETSGPPPSASRKGWSRRPSSHESTPNGRCRVRGDPPAVGDQSDCCEDDPGTGQPTAIEPSDRIVKIAEVSPVPAPNAMRVPSGDQLGSNPEPMRCSPLPVMTHDVDPDRVHVRANDAIRLPSGDQAGSLASRRRPATSVRIPVPFGRMTSKARSCANTIA